jgi:hypothetical protein
MKSNFIKIFGNSPKVLTIDFLLDNILIDFHKSDVAEQTGISRSTLNIFFEDLIKDKLIIKSRIIGRAQMYQVNKQNLIIKKLLQLDKSLTMKFKVELKKIKI